VHALIIACCCLSVEYRPDIPSLCVAQLVDVSSLQLALHFAKAADNPYFRIGYNSLGAYGTINHLHFQVRRCVTALGLMCAVAVRVAAVADPWTLGQGSPATVHDDPAAFARHPRGAHALLSRY